jgi:hypothetical protein
LEPYIQFYHANTRKLFTSQEVDSNFLLDAFIAVAVAIIRRFVPSAKAVAGGKGLLYAYFAIFLIYMCIWSMCVTHILFEYESTVLSISLATCPG